jgi:hypothetical protein
MFKKEREVSPPLEPVLEEPISLSSSTLHGPSLHITIPHSTNDSVGWYRLGEVEKNPPATREEIRG